MKKVLISCIVLVLAVVNLPAYAQAEELEQLALNIEKLAQFKQILSDLKKGYEVLSRGYNTIRDLSEGNFTLHKTFLDGLMAINPAIAGYKRVPDIIAMELKMVKDYKKAFSQFQLSDCFLPSELGYISRVYNNLIDQSVKRLEDLFTVITASRLRMSDDERLDAIDNIHAQMLDMSIFLQSFNNSTSVLVLQRAREKFDVRLLRLMHGIP